MEKVVLTHLAFVDVRVVSETFGSYVVYTLGDGTQPEPTCNMAETCDPGELDEKSSRYCTDDDLRDGFPYPTVRHIDFRASNKTKMGNGVLCQDGSKEKPTKGIITLTAEDFHSFAAIACRAGNRDSTIVADHVQVMERLYYWVGFVAFYWALFFVVYYIVGLCQIYKVVKYLDVK